MKDLQNNQNRFGGAMILLAGDSRYILPVIPRSTPVDELNVCLTFDRFHNFFFCYCQEKVLIKEKIKKIARKIRKFKNT